MASDEEVEAQRDVVVELRARLEEARSGGAETQHELDNDIHLTNLQAEEAKLRAEIAQAEAAQDTQERGAEAPLGSAKEQMQLAMAQQKAIAESVAARNREAAPAAPAPITPAATEVTPETATEAAAKKKVEG